MRYKLRILTLAAAVFLAGAGVVHASTNFAKKIPQATAAIEAPAAKLRIGEHLVYEVYWMGVHVGIGELRVLEKVAIEGREAIHVVAIAKTNDFLSKIYPVNDEVHSYLDAETLQSLRFEKKLSEGNYRAHERVTFDWNGEKIVYDGFRSGTHKEFPLRVRPHHDILSCFYWFRTQPVEVGTSIKTWASDEEEDWEVEIRVLRRETKELRGKRVVDTLLVEPQSKVKGMLYSRGRVWVYFSADSRRVPVWVLFKTPFGPVSGILQNFE